jgi:Tol biopolymer transport system component
LIVAGQDKRGEPVQLNYVSSVTGDISRITNDLNDYYGLSITADSRVMAAAQDDFTSDIWVGTLAAPGKVFPISSGGRAMQPVWSPDGGVVYLAVEGGRTNLWRMQSDGSNPRPLSTMDLGQTMWPRISPDGRSIVFSSTKSGSWHLWRADIHGSNPQQLTHGAHETFSDTSISPDGKWVLFVDPENDNVEGIWKVSVDGGDPILVKKGNVADPVVSPDGKQIAYLYWDEKLKPSRGVAIMPFEAGPPTRLLDIPAGGLAWTPDGRSLLYAKKENEVFNLWIQPLAGGPSRQVTHFDIGSINGYDLSRDGKRLVMDRTTASSRVVLIQDLR